MEAALNISPRSKASFLSRVTWSWMGKLISVANKRPLKMEDVYDLERKEMASYCEHIWNDCYNREGTKKVWKVLLRFVGKEYFLSSVLRPAWMFMLVMQVYVLKTLVQRGSNAHQSFDWVDPLLVFAMFFLPTCQSLFQINLYFITYRVAMRVRAAICATVFKKMLDMKMLTLTASSGTLLNMFTNDIQKVVDGIAMLIYVIMFPVNLIIISLLLFMEAGISGVVGVLVVCAAQACQMTLAKRIGRLWKRKIPITDSRIEMLAEVLSAARVVKFYGWVSCFLQRIADIRLKELRWIKSASYVRAVMSSFRDAAIPLACLTTFGVYVTLHGKLSPAAAFTLLSLYSVLGRDFFALFTGLPQCFEASVAIDRLQKLLDQQNETPLHLDSNTIAVGDNNIVAGAQGSFTWDSKNCTSPILKDINLTLQKRRIIAVTGKVGSGKSSLLLAFLGEMKMVRGNCWIGKEVAYAAQQPWILNDTLCNNILFGNAYSADRYKSVLSACALEQDLLMLADGSDTEIGERGVNLSGGQRARVSLARACYSNAPIVFLDDPFSALDVATTCHLVQHVFGGILCGRTVVVATHTTMCLHAFDEVYLMAENTLRLLSQEEAAHDSLANEDETIPSPVGAMAPSNAKSLKGTLVKEETIAAGNVGFSSYLEYLQMAGWPICVVVLVIFLAGQGAFLMSDYWLRIWTDRKFHLSNRVYVTCLAGIVMATVPLSAVRAALLYKAALTAAKNMHKRMTNQVLRSPIAFFEQNPAGRVLNRFSKDQAAPDDFIPVLSQQVLEYLAASIGGMVLISVLVPWFLLAIPPFIASLIYFRQRYAALCNPLKRLDGISRSPVYAHFVEAMQGAVSIRAYGCQARFHERFLKLLDANQKTVMLYLHGHRWLAVRLDFMTAICITTVAVLTVVLRRSISPGLTGVLLVQSFKLTDLFQYAIRVSADIENHFTSVERIQEYCHLPSEDQASSEPGTISEDWPAVGCIEFVDFTLAYKEQLPPALHHLSFKVEGMEKIGILGRTGSGKSSLVAALFRMVENKSCSGAILVDGVNIKSVGLDDLRQRLSIIPQEPVLFRGSIRYNLDPFQKHKDGELFEALTSSQMVDKVRSLGGLDSVIADNADNFSVGECQLMCLARSLLRRSKILVLDEATASVDDQTDQTLQATVRHVFQRCTVLTVAHRINTVVDSDRVLVMEAGRIVEFDSPVNLLNTQGGGAFADMVARSGKEMAEQLTQQVKNFKKL